VAAEVVQQYRVQFVPDAGPGPFFQTVPEGHAAAAHLAGEVFPGDARSQNEQDATEAQAVVHAGPASLGIGIVFGQKWLDQPPKLIRDQRLGHTFLREQSR